MLRCHQRLEKIDIFWGNIGLAFVRIDPLPPPFFLMLAWWWCNGILGVLERGGMGTPPWHTETATLPPANCSVKV
jgi:hypothetical protein